LTRGIILQMRENLKKSAKVNLKMTLCIKITAANKSMDVSAKQRLSY